MPTPERALRGATVLQDRTRTVAKPVATHLWKINRTGYEHIPTTGGAILCPNHISFLDSAFLLFTVPRRISFVGKAEYMDSWKTKYIFPSLGMIPIDRAGGNASQAALDAAEQVLRRGELFGIFPEGTRSRDGHLYKGKTGAARLAFEVDCPILPVGIRGTADIMPPDAKLPKLRRECWIDIGRPIHPTRYRSRNNERLALRQMTDEVMFEIAQMTGQTYKDVYAGKAPKPAPEQVPGVAEPAGVAGT